MIYCISDIHGEYNKYKRMLERIQFRPSDTLYVLGDVVDRGPKPMAVLQDMMARPNVIPLIGNHEYIAIQCLTFLMTEITEASLARFDADRLQDLTDWLNVGGMSTIDDFRRLTAEEKREILDYLGEFTAYEEVTAGGNAYVLVHAGLSNFSPEKPLAEYYPHEMIVSPPDYSRVYYPDKYLVTGHLPTRNIIGNPRPDRIFRSERHIAIDCGCGFGGPLGAICLDTGEEFYV